MPIVKNDPFPGTDYGSYQKWEKIALPSGEVFYVVPGHPGYVFDPVASNATGRKVFRRNPKEAIAQTQKEQEIRDQQIKQQQYNQSPMGQMMPLATGIGSIYLANKLANGGSIFGNGAATQTLPDVVATNGSGSLGSGSISLGAPVPAPEASGVFTDAAAGGYMGSGSGAYGVQTLADGSTLMSDGSIVASGGSGASSTGGVVGGASSGGGGTPGFAIGEPSMSGYVAGAYTAGKGVYDVFNPDDISKKDQAANAQTAGVMTVANVYTGGLASAVDGLTGGAISKGINKGVRLNNKILDKITFGGTKKLRESIFRETTKYKQKERWQHTGLDPEKYEAMYGHDYFTGTGGEQSRDEKFLTADAIRFNPDNYNNAPDWDSWSKDQQDTFLKRMLDAGKVQEKKGGIYYDDDFAKQTAAEIRNPTPQVKGAAPITVPQSIIDEAAKSSLKREPKWIIRNGKTIKVA